MLSFVIQGSFLLLTSAASYLFNAFNISMTTSTDSAMVIGFGLLKISQSMPSNIPSWAKHWEWWVYGESDR